MHTYPCFEDPSNHNQYEKAWKNVEWKKNKEMQRKETHNQREQFNPYPVARKEKNKKISSSANDFLTRPIDPFLLKGGLH